MVKILILHASDALLEAQSLKQNLNDLGHPVDLVSTTSNEIMIKSINAVEVVIVLVSPSLFNNCYLTFGIGYAMGLNKAISALKESTPALLPSWYQNHFNHIYSHEDLLQKLS